MIFFLVSCLENSNFGLLTNISARELDIVNYEGQNSYIMQTFEKYDKFTVYRRI